MECIYTKARKLLKQKENGKSIWDPKENKILEKRYEKKLKRKLKLKNQIQKQF